MGIKLKRSAVAGKAPVVGDLELGELAVNTYDGKLFTKKNVSGTESIVEIGPVASVAGKTGAVTLAKGDVGLGNVDNTSDANKPISSATQTALDGKAASSHSHAIADVTGLQGALDAKLPASGGQLAGYRLTLNARGSISGAQAINYALGNYVTATIAGATQFSVSNPPANGIGGGFLLVLTNGGSAAITWMSGTKWAGGVPPVLTASGVDVLSFVTHDGGATWRGSVLSLDAK